MQSPGYRKSPPKLPEIAHVIMRRAPDNVPKLHVTRIPRMHALSAETRTSTEVLWFGKRIDANRLQARACPHARGGAVVRPTRGANRLQV